MTGRFVDQSPLLADFKELRRQAQRSGFLFFKGFLDHSIITDARRDIAAVLQAREYCQPLSITDPMGPLRVRNLPKENFAGSGLDREAFLDIQGLASLQTLARAPQLINFFEQLLGSAALMPPTVIARVVFPGQFTTPHRTRLCHR